jgi:predicted Zn-dependent protease
MRWIGLFYCAAVSCAWGQSNSASAQAEQARQLVASGKPEQAIPVYERLLKADPQNPALLANLAVAQYEAGRYADSIEQSQKALKLRPDLTTARLFLGAAYVKSGAPERAIEPFEKVLAARPEERNAILMLAEALRELGRNDEAARRFLAASKLLPDEARVWYGLERSCDAVWRAAVEELNTKAPDSSYSRVLAGDGARRLGRYALAVRRYHEALAVQPETQSERRAALAPLAEVYRASGHADWAEEIERRLSRLTPPGCSSEPECDFQAGRYLELLRAASPVSPELFFWRAKACETIANEAHARLAQLPESAQYEELEARKREEQGIYQQAAEHWRRALRLSPKSAELRRGLALARYHGGDFEQALPVLNELLAGQPDSAEFNYFYGSSLLLSEQPQRAIPYLEKVVGNDPESLAARGALGNALLQIGSYEEAIPHLRAALAVDEDGRIHYQLARAYRGAGHEEQARQALEQYRQVQQAAEAQRQAAEEVFEVAPPR